MSRKSAVSALERGDLSELQHVLNESKWDIGSEPLNSEGQTALHIACANGHLDIVQYLVQSCAVNGEQMATGLLLALLNKKCNVAEYLLKGTSLYFPLYEKVISSHKVLETQLGEILAISCEMGYFELVNFLFKVAHVNIGISKDYIQLTYANEHWDIWIYLKMKKGDTDFSDASPSHLTPLHLKVAWRTGQFEAVKALLELTQKRGTHLSLGLSSTGLFQLTLSVKEAYDAVRHINVRAKVNDHVVSIAQGRDYVEVLKFLCKLHYLAETNPSDYKFLSEIHVVCIMGDVEGVKRVLKSDGPSVLNKIDHYGILAIKYAIYEPEVLRTIVKALGNNVRDGNGNTPLHHCITYQCIESLNIITEVPSCNVNLLNNKGETSLHVACTEMNIAAIQSLIVCKRCNPNIPDSNGDTALHIAVRSKSQSIEMLQCLLQSDRCELNKTNKQHYTPLHIACKIMNVRAVEILVAVEKCDPNIPNLCGDTALHMAVRSKSQGVQMVHSLLKSGKCDINVTNKRHYTPLHIACKNSNSEVLKALVAEKNVNIQQTTNDEFQNAPIHIACMYCRLNNNIIKFLLDKNCDPNQQNAKGDTALHTLCKITILQQFHVMNMKYLLKSGRCNPNVINKSGCTPLHIVSHQGYINLLGELVACETCDLNIQDANGDTALHIGVENDQIVQYLLERGRSKCDIYNQNGMTPFHKAITNGIMTSVEVMMKNGVNILQTTNDKFQNAPIHIACKCSRLYILKVLLCSSNCDPNQQNAVGDTALHIICKMVESKLLYFQELISTPGFNPNIANHEGHFALKVTDNDSNTLLHSACAEGNNMVLQFLMKNGADILAHNGNGEAPIHIACQNSRLDILKTLLGCRGCDPNQQTANGDTALHIVSRNSNSEEMVDILVNSGADILRPNGDGNFALHIACRHMRINVMKALLCYKECNYNQQNAKGDTAVHIVCRLTHSRLLYLQAFISIPGLNLKIVNHEGLVPFQVVDNDGNSVLHTACAEENTEVVKFLVKNGADLLQLNRRGDAPIHIACQYSRLDILKVLLGSGYCDPNQQNASGDTALHIVCKMKPGGHEQKFIKTLISIPGISLEVVNHEGKTPIEVAGTNYTAIGTIMKLLKHKKSSIQAYLKIFVVGNSGNGKSTLIKAVTTEASQLLKYVPLPKMKYVNSSDVPPHTAGIVPISFKSKHFGNAVLYDFAGQHEYYSSHAAVMENLILPSPPLFLLLIDISKSKEVMREELVYWWHFINNQSQKAAAPPHVILAGSHKDMVKTRDREELEVMIRDWIKGIPVMFEFVGYFPVDCRKLASRGLSALLTQLNTTCQTLRGIVDVNLHCHILNTLLKAPEFQDLVYCKVVDIMNKIGSDDTLLPKTFSQLIPLLANLNDQGYILLLQNYTDEEKSWVILKPDRLLAEVNGSVFAPKYFKEHSEIAISTGVVPLSKLKEKFSEYNYEVIVKYLTHLEFCFRVKDQYTLDMITNNEVPKSAATEEYYFFPSLVRVENPTNVYQPHQSVDYECGWLYKCHKETEQLTTRFLHVLILRLAFACEPPDDPTEAESVVLLRSCSVWKHGIAWWTNDGIEIIVEVGLQCRWVAVTMRCPATERVQCAELRSKVIKTVLGTKTKFCPAITMKEYLISPSSQKYPFKGRELTLYSMREVARAMIEGKKFAKDTKGYNLINLPQLLPFEPYHNMRDLIWKFFSGDTLVAVTPEELTQIAEKCHGKLAELKAAFQPDIGSFQRECEKADCTEVERCVALFHILQRRGRFKTWKDFQEEFSRFSVFCEQSLVVRMMAYLLMYI